MRVPTVICCIVVESSSVDDSSENSSADDCWSTDVPVVLFSCDVCCERRRSDSVWWLPLSSLKKAAVADSVLC
jgi:hypothetical protein